MIEREKGSGWRTDGDLRAGDWIQFEEEFLYGDAATGRQALSGLVYFAAPDGEAPFVLCGSSVHVLDRWQSGDRPGQRIGSFYLDALIACARELAELPDEAATTEFTPTETGSGLRYALGVLCAVEPYDGGRPSAVLATPLYVQYAERG